MSSLLKCVPCLVLPRTAIWRLVAMDWVVTLEKPAVVHALRPDRPNAGRERSCAETMRCLKLIN